MVMSYTKERYLRKLDRPYVFKTGCIQVSLDLRDFNLCEYHVLGEMRRASNV
jgi:hypothetical protein